MLLRRLSAMLVVLAFGVFGAACASSGTGTEAGAAQTGGGGPTGMQIVVDNNVAGAESYIVFIVPEAGGVQQQIGQIEPGETRTYRYTGTPGNFTLRVQGTTGARTSQRFRMFANSTATWRLDSNTVRVTGG